LYLSASFQPLLGKIDSLTATIFLLAKFAPEVGNSGKIKISHLATVGMLGGKGVYREEMQEQ
jgi:hypothetical protein